MGGSVAGQMYEVPDAGEVVELSLPSPERASCTAPVLVSLANPWLLVPRWKARTGVLSRSRQRLAFYEDDRTDGAAAAALADGLDALDLRGAEAKPSKGGLRISLADGRRLLLKPRPAKESERGLPKPSPPRHRRTSAEAFVAAVVDVCQEAERSTSSVRLLAAELGSASPLPRQHGALPPHLLLEADAAEDDDNGGDVCPVCLEELWRSPVCYLSDGRRRRSCTHVLHAHCARQLQGRRCPSCRRGFARERVMPPLEFAPAQWVAVLARGDVVKRADVVNALAAQYPFDKAAVEAHLPWKTWANDDGDLDAAKLADGDTGLKATVLGGGAAEPGAWNSSKWGSLFRRLTKASHQAPLVVAD